MTKGLRSLLQDVLSRLSGGQGSRILKLMTPFGGGKSHTLAALLHVARTPKAMDAVSEGQGLPRVQGVRTAVFDGLFFDTTNGKVIPGEKFRARTIWGWIAWSLGGKKGYEILRAQDEARVSPGGDEILKLLAEGPNLILLDEVLNYLISAGGMKVHQTTLRDETLTFLQRLTVAVGNTTNTAMVFSLQSSKRESLDYVNLLQTVDHLAARKDQRREPVEGKEIQAVIQRRLLAKIPDAEVSTPVAAAYQETVTQMRRAHARSAAEQRQAEEDGLALRDRIRTAYPFHPALIDLMRERWAAIPDFQRTRGALRFLAACLRACHREGKSRVVLGPGDVPIHDSEVRLAFFKEVGQQADYQAVLEHDLMGANARARQIDERRAKEVPSQALKRPAMRLATAILMYSFGGLRREGAEEGEVLPPGVSEAELLAACVGPDLDSITALACLKELRERCLYLHFDGVRYCFKKDPNVTLLVEQEADAVARDERRVEDKIKEMLEERLAGHRSAIVWPPKPADVPDNDPSFLVAYMPLSFGTEPRASQEETAKRFFEKCGDKPRNFRNGLGLAIPAADQIEVLRRAVRYVLACEGIKGKPKQHNLTDGQKGQLREREATERAAVESALLKLYTEVWLPRIEESNLCIDAVAVGGRPLQTTLDEKKQALIHERVMELLMGIQRRVFDSLKPTKIVELFKLGEGTPPKVGIRTSEIVSGFYSFLGFTRLASDDAICKAIACGVQERVFGYVGGTPEIGLDGKYQVAPGRERFGAAVAEDEIDLESGFLMMPAAIPQPAAVPGPGTGPIPPGPGQPPPGSGPGVGQTTPGPPSVPPGQSIQRVVEITFSANRDQLFAAWNALANLADMAGKVAVSVHAESTEGFERGKLQNGVMEPLREADLIE
ncbi:MAG: ATP-binding protein [Phycisphaerae bacterium]|nr:ATP-binding protein [Phycisphaerae bacterium]